MKLLIQGSIINKYENHWVSSYSEKGYLLYYQNYTDSQITFWSQEENIIV